MFRLKKFEAKFEAKILVSKFLEFLEIEVKNFGKKIVSPQNFWSEII